MQEIFPAIALLGVIYASYRFYKWLQAQPQRRDDLYYKNACNSIHALEEMVEELEALDEIITDLHTCNHKYLKGVRLSVPSALGHDNEYTILADGQGYSSRQLLAIAYSERAEKRDRLRRAITELYSKGIVTRYYYLEEEEDEVGTETENE